MAGVHRRASLCLAALLSVAMAALENQTGQVAVFCGRHNDEGSLREACNSGMYTSVIMSFLNVYGHERYHLDLSGHQLASIGDDIKHCQLERIHVRFYDNDGHTDCNGYSEEVWDRWTAAYPSSQIFLGLPASPKAAKEGYLYPKSLYYGVLPVVQKVVNYGGVMLWDRYYDKHSNYSSYVKRWA
ncbi:Xylanase inhibitor protein 1 [Dichanthelium oligosanthes]|uniref:Xylanase inhibitor protein 1 n=1 Tax=Dichanthelium oligosanthes TaxID=888268 RepID=A0A1E5W2V4_9POAL|nr:Xylanase inhibitor protein 1 [Dichanthelium oligosanthes]